MRFASSISSSENSPLAIHSCHSCSICLVLTWGSPKLVVPNNHGKILLKMIGTWGVKWGYHHLRKHPRTPLPEIVGFFSPSSRVLHLPPQPARVKMVKSSLHRSNSWQSRNHQLLHPVKHSDMGVSLNGGTPPFHTPKWSFLVGFSHGCWGNPHFRKPPYIKFPLCFDFVLCCLTRCMAYLFLVVGYFTSLFF